MILIIFFGTVTISTSTKNKLIIMTIMRMMLIVIIMRMMLIVIIMIIMIAFSYVHFLSEKFTIKRNGIRK